MFDLTSSKLLILGLVALIVVGPKDLPVLLRTIGKYVGMMRRQANEFRAQFEEAMRDTELASLKSEMEAMKRDVHATVHAATSSVTNEVNSATREIDGHLKNGMSGAAAAHTANGWHEEPVGAAAPASAIPAVPAGTAAHLAEHPVEENSIGGSLPRAAAVPPAAETTPTPAAKASV